MKYFTFKELCFSTTAQRLGIDNTPDLQSKLNLIALTNNVLDVVRERIGEPVIVSSGYRCQALNEAVGGVPNSQHVKGMAADIVGFSVKPREVFCAIVNNTEYDQCILYPTFVHVSYNEGCNRNQSIIRR